MLVNAQSGQYHRLYYSIPQVDEVPPKYSVLLWSIFKNPKRRKHKQNFNFIISRYVAICNIL